jgi:hypothetical protein
MAKAKGKTEGEAAEAEALDIEAEQEKADEAETAGEAIDTKADVEDYVRVYRIEHRGTEDDSEEPDLGEEFDDEPFELATVREAIAHGWRVEDGVTADRTDVARFDRFNVDVTYSVPVVPAAGAPAGTPVGETKTDVAEADPFVDESKVDDDPKAIDADRDGPDSK